MVAIGVSKKISRLKELAIIILKNCQVNPNTEKAHRQGDDVLCDLLKGLGYSDVVKEYNKIDKRYT